MSGLTTAATSTPLESSSEENTIDVNSARYLKLVVAVAVIRSRPPGLSGQQYAERLYVEYQQSVLKWKSRADALQDELLALQQAIVRSELVMSTLAGGGGGERVEGDMDRDEYGCTYDRNEQKDSNYCRLPTSYGGRLKRCAVTNWRRRAVHPRISSDTAANQVVPGGGHDKDHASDDTSTDQSNHSPQLNVPGVIPPTIDTGQYSNIDPVWQYSTIDNAQYSVNNLRRFDLTKPVRLSDQRVVLDRHLLFLRTVLGFGSMRGRTRTVAKGDVDQLTLCTLRWVLDNVVQGLCDLTLGGDEEDEKGEASEGSLMTEGLAKQAITTIGGLADRMSDGGGKDDGGREEGDEIIDVIVNAAEKLVSAIIDCRRLENTGVQTRLVDCLLIWSDTSSSLRDPILILLLRTILDCGSALRRSTDSLPRGLPPHLVENVFHVFRCLEQILEREASLGVVGGGEEGGARRKRVGEGLCLEASRFLSEAVLHLTSRAPMFCHYVWRIMALVDIVLCVRNNNNNNETKK